MQCSRREPDGKDAAVLNLAVIGGDGTGPEVVAEGLKVLQAAADTDQKPEKTQDALLLKRPTLIRGALGARGPHKNPSQKPRTL